MIHSDDYSREKFDRPTESTLQRFSYFMRFDDVRAIETTTTTTTTSTEQSSYRLDHLVGIWGGIQNVKLLLNSNNNNNNNNGYNSTCSLTLPAQLHLTPPHFTMP